MALYDDFINDVQENPDKHCKEVILAVQRHLNDLEKVDDDNYQFYFSRDNADHYIEVIKLLKHTKGAWRGKPFNLQPFQAFIMAMLFGWLYKNDDNRRFTKVYADMGRGGGKSEFAAALQVIFFLFTGENTPNIVSAATSRDQAKYVYTPTREMLKMLCEDSEFINEKIRLYRYYIQEIETNGTLGTMTADAGRNDGGDIYMGTIDELHAHRDTSLIKIIETGQGKRVGTSPLLLIITTAGHNKQGPGMKYRKYTQDILNGHIENDGFFGIVFKLDDKEEMHDEKMWYKSNPALGSTPSLKQLRQQYINATTEGSMAMYEFLTKNMNLYVDTPRVWIEEERIKRCIEEEFDEKLLEGRDCYIGLDLSSSHDLSAAPLLFLPTKDDPVLRLRHKFFCPKAAKVMGSSTVDGVDYRQWMDDGYIEGTHGDTIDYEAIIEWIRDCNAKYNIRCVEYDPWHKAVIIPRLVQGGISCDSYPQNFKEMTPVLTFIEAIINSDGKNIGEKVELVKDFEVSVYPLKIEKNPVFMWNMANVEIQQNSNGNGRRPGKNNKEQKIDGVVAFCNAIGGYLSESGEEKFVSVYEKKGVTYL